jgi:threonine dehydratase
VAEGAAAVGVAVVTGGQVPTDRPVVIVLTGRNVAPVLLADLLVDPPKKETP